MDKTLFNLLPEETRRAVAVALGPYAISGEKRLAKALVLQIQSSAVAYEFIVDEGRRIQEADAAALMSAMHDHAITCQAYLDLMERVSALLARKSKRMGITS